MCARVYVAYAVVGQVTGVQRENTRTLRRLCWRGPEDSFMRVIISIQWRLSNAAHSFFFFFHPGPVELSRQGALLLFFFSFSSTSVPLPLIPCHPSQQFASLSSPSVRPPQPLPLLAREETLIITRHSYFLAVKVWSGYLN